MAQGFAPGALFAPQIAPSTSSAGFGSITPSPAGQPSLQPQSNLFAPPPGAGLDAWNAQRISPAQDPFSSIEASRMPLSPDDIARILGGTSPDIASQRGGNGNPYGEGNVPDSYAFGDSRGMVDPAALQAAAMGLPYDAAARRSAIAQQMAQNQAAQQSALPVETTPQWRMTTRGGSNGEYSNDVWTYE